MADANNPAAQNTDAAQGGDQAGAGTSVMTATLPGDGNAADPAKASDSNNPAGDTGAADGSGQTDKKDDTPKGAPDKYDLKMPDGTALDEAALADLEPVARELNLTNEQAQKLAETYANRMQQDLQRQQENWKRTTEEWVGAIKADKEIGGQNFDVSVRHAQAALNKFGSAELRAQMDATGMGNHPELVRVFARIGKAMAEDTFVQSSRDGVQADPAKKLFPSMN
jgi:hypothetical protein